MPLVDRRNKSKTKNDETAESNRVAVVTKQNLRWRDGNELFRDLEAALSCFLVVMTIIYYRSGVFVFFFFFLRQTKWRVTAI